MKTFEEVHVFLPNDEESKAHMKDAYIIFRKMTEKIAEQLKTKTYEHGLLMINYAPAYMMPLVKPYGVKLYYDKPSDTLYMTLVLISGDHSEPICYVNVSSNQPAGVDCDCSAYILMVAFINHLGMMYNKEMEEGA